MENTTSGPQPRRELSDAELAAYTIADPHAQTSTKPWELEVTSPYLKKIAVIAACVIIPIHIFMGVVLDIEYTGAAVTAIDKWAFPAVGVIISGLLWWALSRVRLRANEDGVEVRNLIGTRFYPWIVAYGLAFPEGARMARLELPDFEYVPVWALQSGDKNTILGDVKKFRELEARYMPTE